MRSFALVLAIVTTIGVWVADTLLLGIPAFRNQWWTLTLFAFPAACLALGWGGQSKRSLKVSAWLVFLVGLGGWVSLRTLTGNIEGTPAVAVGDVAPNFMLQDHDGQNVRLSDLSDQGRVVLVFFRGKG